MREYLRKRIVTECMKKGDFTLSSGKKSDTYLDIRKLSFDKDGLLNMVKLLYEIMISENLYFDSIGGPAIGSIPIVAGLLAQDNFIQKGYTTRSLNKNHGTKKLVEGTITKNTVIIEDVITTGNSILDTVNLIRKENKNNRIGAILCVVDRSQQETYMKKDFYWKWKQDLKYDDIYIPVCSLFIYDGALL